MKYPEPRQHQLFVKRIIKRFQALPVVEAVAVSTALPFFSNDNGSFVVQGHPTSPSPAFIPSDPKRLGAAVASAHAAAATGGRWYPCRGGSARRSSRRARA